MKLVSLPNLQYDPDLVQWARELVDVLQRTFLDIDKRLTKIEQRLTALEPPPP